MLISSSLLQVPRDLSAIQVVFGWDKHAGMAGFQGHAFTPKPKDCREMVTLFPYDHHLTISRTRLSPHTMSTNHVSCNNRFENEIPSLVACLTDSRPDQLMLARSHSMRNNRLVRNAKVDHAITAIHGTLSSWT